MLERNFLESLGLTKEQVDEVIRRHTDSTAAYQTRIDELNAELLTAQTEAAKVPDLEARLKTALDDAGYKEKYEKKDKEFKAYQQRIESEAARRTKESVYRKLLKDGVNVPEEYLDVLMKASNEEIDALQLDESGNATDAEKLTETLREKYKAFAATKTTIGAESIQPPKADTTPAKTESEAAKRVREYQAQKYGSVEAAKKGE